MVEFIGSTIQKIGFVPHTYTLLVARSNGDLILLDPPMEDDRAQTRDATQPWLTLPAPAYQFAFSRDGDRLAVACEDNRVRILDVLDGAELGQIHLSARASSVDFNAARDVLLVRLNTGLLELYELERLQQIGSWALDGADGHPLAAWIGGADDIVWTGPNGMIHVTFTEADQAVLLNEAFAHQREISRLLAAGDLSGARQSAEQLRFANPALGATAARDLLAVLLRSRLGDLPYEWIDTVLDEADPSTRLRLAHAAYAGGRFELAQRGLLAAGASTTDDTDSYSAWRLAECTYLLGSYEAADDALAQLLRRTDLAAGDLPRMRLERLAALVFSGRIEQAHQVFERYKTLSNSSDDRETVGMMATLLIGNHLLGNQEQTQLDTSSRAFLNVFKEQWLDYRDDIEFFVGELARMRGDVRAARSQYQLCIDSARDVWPADWARLRLEQMDAGIASGTPE
jgi:hypothetical protein